MKCSPRVNYISGNICFGIQRLQLRQRNGFAQVFVISLFHHSDSSHFTSVFLTQNNHNRTYRWIKIIKVTTIIWNPRLLKYKINIIMSYIRVMNDFTNVTVASLNKKTDSFPLFNQYIASPAVFHDEWYTSLRYLNYNILNFLIININLIFVRWN